jgi:hypothetical protein
VVVRRSGRRSRFTRVSRRIRRRFASPSRHDARVEPSRYRIVVQGGFGPRCHQWFRDLEIAEEGDDTALEGVVSDQAQLQGLLVRIASLNLTLVSVNKLDGRPD